MIIRRLPNEPVLKIKKETYREFMEKIYTNIEKNKYRLDCKYEIFKDLVMKCLNLNPIRIGGVLSILLFKLWNSILCIYNYLSNCIFI